MTSSLIIRPEAENDIDEAHKWYEKQRTGLGEDFLLCIEDGLAKLRRNPIMYPLVYKNIRRFLIHRFPFGIFYLVEPEKIVILAVLHGRRNPMSWKKRK